MKSFSREVLRIRHQDYIRDEKKYTKLQLGLFDRSSIKTL